MDCVYSEFEESDKCSLALIKSTFPTGRQRKAIKKVVDEPDGYCGSNSNRIRNTNCYEDV
jgi:hypothetical protein